MFGRRAAPAIVVKLDRSAVHAKRLVVEHETLRALEDQDRFRGLVPRSVGLAALPVGQVLVQTGLAGQALRSVLWHRSAAARLRRAPRDHELLHGWLTRLSDWDAGRVPPMPHALQNLAQRLRDALGDEAAHAARSWLSVIETQARGAPFISVPSVRGHGDLGPSNFLDHRGERRLVDWEADTSAQPRLVDVVVGLNHYVRAMPLADGRLPNRREAAERAFLGDDPIGRFTRRSWDRAIFELGIERAAANLLLVDALVRLATGQGGGAHSQRGRRMGTGMVRHLAIVASEHPRSWPPTR